MPLHKVEDLADTTLAQKISQLPGVGLVTISGGQKPAVRVQANPDCAGFLRPEPGRHAHGAGAPTWIRPREISTARGSPTPSAPTTRYLPAPTTSPVIVGYKNGAPVRVQDIATVIDGVENASQAAWYQRDAAP